MTISPLEGGKMFEQEFTIELSGYDPLDMTFLLFGLVEAGND